MAKDGRHATLERKKRFARFVRYGLAGAVVPTEDEDAGVVYFVGRGPFIKIGTTSELDERLVHLRYYRDPGGGIGPVDVLCVLPGGFGFEAELHRRFEHLSVDGFGEWFHGQDELLGMLVMLGEVEEICGITFDS